MKIRLLAVPTLALVVAVPICVAEPASAAALTNNQLKHALMKKSDIPKWLSKTPTRSTTFQDHAAASKPLVCFKNAGPDVTGRKPQRRAAADIKLGGSETTGTALEAFNFIFAYKSAKSGSNAWNGIEKKAKACPADATINRTSGGETVNIRQTTKYSKKGADSFVLVQHVWISGTGTNVFTAQAQERSVWRHVGSTVEVVKLNKSTQISANTALFKKQRDWVASEAEVVARRLAAQSA